MPTIVLTPVWNKHLNHFQYGPDYNSPCQCALVVHCHPKNQSWIDQGDTESRDAMSNLLSMHGYQLRVDGWIL